MGFELVSFRTLKFEQLTMAFGVTVVTRVPLEEDLKTTRRQAPGLYGAGHVHSGRSKSSSI